MRPRSARWNLLFVLLLSAVIAEAPGRAVRLSAAPAWKIGSGLPSKEFSRLIQDFSEPGGYFRSDNFTSNETSYLTVVDKLHDLRVSGGAYIGVGPEQNFTYIAKIRPAIAFIVDIRRQEIIQHLLYKAIFHEAPTRVEFLSGLLSRPIANEKIRHADSISDMVEYFAGAAAPEDVFADNLERVRKIIEQNFRFPLDRNDQARLEYVYGSFRRAGLAISYRVGNSYGFYPPQYRSRLPRVPFGSNSPFLYGGFPTLGDLVLQTDPNGHLGNFLASDDDYKFVRHLQEKNRIIPIVGDFAGTKAFSSIGAYLTRNGYRVSAFYTSNVEQFLFQNGVYETFVANVRKLPIDGTSVFIRAVPRMGGVLVHPTIQPGQRTTTILEKMSIFLSDEESEPYRNYWDMVTTHYIAGGER